MSGNDLRYAYNLLEVAYYSTTDGVVNIDIIKSINNKPNIFHDKNQVVLIFLVRVYFRYLISQY